MVTNLVVANWDKWDRFEKLESKTVIFVNDWEWDLCHLYPPAFALLPFLGCHHE